MVVPGNKMKDQKIEQNDLTSFLLFSWAKFWQIQKEARTKPRGMIKYYFSS